LKKLSKSLPCQEVFQDQNITLEKEKEKVEPVQTIEAEEEERSASIIKVEAVEKNELLIQIGKNVRVEEVQEEIQEVDNLLNHKPRKDLFQT
jgi:DNA-directed RNA polymerase